MSYKDHVKKAGELATATNEQLQKEQERRTAENIFPLFVFNDKLKPLMDILHTKVDTPRSYIGLAFLGAYSSAIGTSYVVKNSIGEVCLATWCCFTGISSSGKSTALKYAYKPLLEIQREFDKEYEEMNRGNDEDRRKIQIKTVIFRDIHIPTLIRDIFPDNPKGVTKHADEILEWINGFNAYSKKESTDEQFWLSSWNCLPYSGIRSGKVKFNVEKTFTNIFGGIQPTLLKELFAKNRGKSGFTFRLLFTNPNESKISDPVTNFDMPEEFLNLHRNAIRRLYIEKPVLSHYSAPDICVINQAATDRWNDWCKKKITTINKMKDIKEREISSSIYGKMKEYALRFAGILHLMDKALEENSRFEPKETITEDTMIRALHLADYFYQSAEDTYQFVDQSKTVPEEVLVMAMLWRRGKSWSEIANDLYGNTKFKSKAHRNFKKWSIEYPKQFGSEA